MVAVSQTEDEIKIIIDLNKVVNTKPVVVVLNNFIKFNCPPVYFESFLWGEVEDDQSVCRLFKKQARITLKKRECGMWPQILEAVPKEEALKKKIELNDLLVERTQKEDKERCERYEVGKREKLQFQIDREMSIHDKVKAFNEACVAESMSTRDTKIQDPLAGNVSERAVQTRKTPQKQYKYIPPPLINNTRKSGRIQISFSDYKVPTPKRESQPQGNVNMLADPNAKVSY